MVDAVLLDWEDTLVCTAPARLASRERALAEQGVTDAELEHDDALRDLVAMRAARHFAEHLGKGVVLEPGGIEFFERIQIGARLAIVTSATRAETEFVLRLAGLDAAASVIVSADGAHGNAYQRALDHLGRRKPVASERTVAMASTAGALACARAANVRTIAVATPAHIAVLANGTINGVNGLTLGDVARIAGMQEAGMRS